MKQNVNGTTAAIVIIGALILFFLVFSRLRAPDADLRVVPIPEAPEVNQTDMNNAVKGLAPLGVLTVLPPLVEDRMKGVRISAVIPRTPAERAGLKPADLIVRFDGRSLVSKDALIYFLSQVSPKKTYQMEVNRSGKRLTLQVSGLTPLPPEERVEF